MLRSSLAAASLCALLASSSAAAPARAPAGATAATPPVFVISGRGWGHGVGMSQWGAHGFARRGYGYQRIVAHYYRGTTLRRAPVARVRVLLFEGRKSLEVSSVGPWRVRDAAGEVFELDPGSRRLGPGLRVAVEEGKPARALAGPLLFSGELAPLAINGKRYRGSLEISVEKGRLRAINVVGLDAYLYGVVPDEVPSDWPAEALKAQAVVARSYALAVRKTGPYDLHDDTRSQVYGGVGSEEAATTEAVNATAGLALFFGGKVATTFFFSTSGGRTASVADVWQSEPIPYLVSVPDPYDAMSPHHTWGPYQFTPQRLGKALGVRGSLLDVRTTRNPSRRVDAVLGVGPAGESTRTGAEVRRSLGLRSTWFRIGVLSLDRQTKPVVWGSRVEVTGRARQLAGVRLEQRAGSTLWETAAVVTPRGDGTFAVPAKPLVTTEYRLAAGTVVTPPIRIGVAPLVRLAAPRDSAALRGTVLPLLPGVEVIVQRLEGSAWRAAARTTIDAQGRFEARLALSPGTYRARVAPGRGFVPGFSPVLDVFG